MSVEEPDGCVRCAVEDTSTDISERPPELTRNFQATPTQVCPLVESYYHDRNELGWQIQFLPLTLCDVKWTSKRFITSGSQLALVPPLPSTLFLKIYVSVNCVCGRWLPVSAVPLKARRGSQRHPLELELKAVVRCSTWVLGVEEQPSARAEHPLHHWDSPTSLPTPFLSES